MGTFPPIESVKQLVEVFAVGLPEDELAAKRRTWGEQLAQQMTRIVELRLREARSRNTAQVLGRIAPGVTAAVTTVTGGTLAAHLPGTAATVLGITAALLGVAGAALAAWRPNELYALGVSRAARYERLWWDMYQFGTTDLVTVDRAAWRSTHDGFSRRAEEIVTTLASPR